MLHNNFKLENSDLVHGMFLPESLHIGNPSVQVSLFRTGGIPTAAERIAWLGILLKTTYWLKVKNLTLIVTN